MSAEFFPDWERSGFSARPETYTANGDELILRAYTARVNRELDFTSRKVGNCFFVPACGAKNGPVSAYTINPALWTGGFLEQRLNAFVFGNGYERLTVWALQPGVQYDIGFVGFDTRTTVPVNYHREPGPIELYRHRGAPSPDPFYFRQVKLQIVPGAVNTVASGAVPIESYERSLRRCVREVADAAIVMPLSEFVGRA